MRCYKPIAKAAAIVVVCIPITVATYKISFITISIYGKSGAIIITANTCLLYTSDAADDLLCVDLGGRRIIKKKKQKHIIRADINL